MELGQECRNICVLGNTCVLNPRSRLGEQLWLQWGAWSWEDKNNCLNFADTFLNLDFNWDVAPEAGLGAAWGVDVVSLGSSHIFHSVCETSSWD